MPLKIQTPEWVKDAVFYQIFPDRFAKSLRLIKPTNIEPWETPPTTFGYKGGDLYGVLEHLDHIQDLGFNAIYFTPIFQSACNHRYHTHDYYQIDPLLGGNPAFFALRDEMKRRGMKLLLDGVFNHASRGIYYFNDILENGPNSAYLDWFTVEDFPLSAYDDSKPANYVAWVGLRALPKWNTDNPQVREYIMKVAEYWLHQGIDGWRLDVPFCITSPGFWNEFRERVKKINPEAYIVGEVWWDSTNYLQGDQFDAVMNYLFTEPVLQFVGQDHLDRRHAISGKSYDPYPPIDGEHFAVKIEKQVFRYDWEITQAQLNLLDSHDTPRLITICSGDKASLKLATLFLMTFPGAPSVYYGDEIGLPGADDPDCRRTMPWTERENWDQELLSIHKQLIGLRHQYKALRRGTYRGAGANKTCYAFSRILGKERLIVAANVGTQSETLSLNRLESLPEGTTFQVLYGQGQASFEGGRVSLTLPPREGMILRID